MPKITCLECGKPFDVLSPHLRRAHGMSSDDYRERFQLPRGEPLVSSEVSETRRRLLLDMVADGRVQRPDQAELTAAARGAGRPDKTPEDKRRHRAIIQQRRPGDHARLPDGAKRADGRNADRAREYQQAYRALRAGDSGPMEQYRRKYG
ncbi:MucR family transcriptional regulator [Chromobacterium phragmitis]|uniref:MucR family transcriptional regulator n=1 Tax=Chromobacterium amazonense TaxID=1382803 RepID=UPI0021B7AC0F|nr:MucR family transcriptional regulator [Chromobacterium amazonense]MBM2884080.1 MucR family transcriptional regulator [Chromobacterium amazonense]